MIGDGGKGAPSRAVIWLLRLTAFADPAMEFVAVEAIVAAVDETHRRPLFEREHGHTAALCRSRVVQYSGRGANLTNIGRA